jgi:hypothetical protein
MCKDKTGTRARPKRKKIPQSFRATRQKTSCISSVTLRIASRKQTIGRVLHGVFQKSRAQPFSAPTRKTTFRNIFTTVFISSTFCTILLLNSYFYYFVLSIRLVEMFFLCCFLLLLLVFYIITTSNFYY